MTTSPPISEFNKNPGRGSGLVRPLPPAILFSLISHLLLVLVLSLVAFGAGARVARFEPLMISQAAEFELNEAPTFELEPELPQPTNLQAEVDDEIFLPVDIPAAPKLELAEEAEAEVTATAETTTSNEALPRTVSIAAQRVAMSIQKRVSNAGGKRGEVQFALAWKNVNDVDLHVIAPSGERISHSHKRSTCNGMLDVDMNVRGESDEPVENVRWLTGAPWGRYTVIVHLFRIHRDRKANGRAYRGSEFQLLTQLGEETQIDDGMVNRNAQLRVYHLQYIPSSLPTARREQMLQQLAMLQEKEESQAQPMLERAQETQTRRLRDRMLNNLIMQFPHTKTAIEAMQLLGGNITKN